MRNIAPAPPTGPDAMTMDPHNRPSMGGMPGSSAGGPAFQTQPKPDTGNELSWIMGPTPTIGKGLTVKLSRLLDMPVERSMFTGSLSYCIRIFDERDKELMLSAEIASQSKSADVETVNVPEKLGAIRLRTESPLLYVQVEHAGGMMAGGVIGRCQIHRLDPRSSQVWPYLLSDHDGVPVNCGVELMIEEENGAGPGPAASGQMSGLMGAAGPRKSAGQPPRQPAIQDMNHGVSAFLELEKVSDIPAPRNPNLRQVVLTIVAADRDKELRRAGPFETSDQGPNLRRASCHKSRVFVQAPLHFGGDAEEGAMYVKVLVSYTNTQQSSQGTEPIGVTESIKVAWRPQTKKYYEIRQKGTRSVLGGISLTHRLMTEEEVGKQHPGQSIEMPHAKAIPQLGPPIEPLHRVSGRTGNFPPGSREEALEQAAINGEAQNRAFLQRCKIADRTCHERDPHIKYINGYREWDSLDSLFTTMGPNPLAFSDELGANVARSYQESTSVYKEIAPNLPPVRSPADEHLNLELLRMMYKEDPRQVHTALRPTVCKDPEVIAASRDMGWCPDPPVYAPLRNMREEDKETLRLACFDPSQSAKLFFADANPNYRMNEDIWGILAEYKTAQSLVVPKRENRQRRVKDDCLMA